MTDITPIIISIIGILSVIITVILIPLIRSKTTISQQNALITAVHIAVYAAEQIFKAAKSGAEKKSYVLKYLNRHGITYNEDEVNAAIEAEVQSLNIMQGK